MNITELLQTSINTLYFNYKIFGIRNMLNFYAIIGPHTKFGTLPKGAVILRNPSFACLKIGVGEGSFHHGKAYTSFVSIGNNSILDVIGKASIARGGVLNISNDASIILGNGFSANYGCVISIAKSLVCDTNVRLGWDISIIDSDGHSVKSLDNQKRVNDNRGIHLGENVWLAAKCTIMKGVHLAKNTIVPFGNIITKSNDIECVVFGGQPNRVLKQRVYRDYASEKN